MNHRSIALWASIGCHIRWADTNADTNALPMLFQCSSSASLFAKSASLPLLSSPLLSIHGAVCDRERICEHILHTHSDQEKIRFSLLANIDLINDFCCFQGFSPPIAEWHAAGAHTDGLACATCSAVGALRRYTVEPCAGPRLGCLFR